MSGKFKNSNKTKFLATLPKLSIENPDLQLIERSVFNFSFFDGTQDAGSDFSSLSATEMTKLIEKIKNYSRSSLNYWRQQRCGSGSLKILEIYGGFPKNSDFSHPSGIPHDVLWGRFRLDNFGRLIGFVLPPDLDHKFNKDRTYAYSCNIFYVVFLDPDHKFYKTENK